MKLVIVLVGVFAAVNCGLPPDVLEKIKQTILKIGEECKTEIGATDDDIAPIKSHELPSTHTGKCFLACMDKKFGFMNKSGKIDKEESYAMLDKLKSLDEALYDKMRKVADVCLVEVTDTDDECETAHNMMSCIHRENKVVGLSDTDF